MPTVKQIQAVLKKRGLPTKGRKAQLEEILRKDDERLAGVQANTVATTSAERPSKRQRTSTTTTKATTKATTKTTTKTTTKATTKTTKPTKPTSTSTTNTDSSVTIHVTSGVSLGSGSIVENKKRGVRVSGRFWKQPQKRTSNRRSKADQKRLWDQKELGKQGYKSMKNLEKDFIANREAERKARIEKLVAKRKRKAENEMKSSTYQQITSDSKIKRMSKNQLKLVKRMQVNAYTGVAELVSPWAGRQIRGKHAGTWRGR